MAAKLEVPMFVASTVRQVYEAAHAQGFGQLDMAAVTRLYEHWSRRRAAHPDRARHCDGRAPSSLPDARAPLPGAAGAGRAAGPPNHGLCWVYCYTWNPERPLTETERQRLRAGQSVHADVDERWVPRRNRDNDYLIDREDQKLRTFTGIRGISEQDACIQDRQGFIADRTREHLGPSDAAIIQLRRLMLGAARDLRRGVEPPAARSATAYAVRSGSVLADRSVAFADVMLRRFGDVVGRVGREPLAPQASSETYSSPASSLSG